ncbi:2'-5' RNA ligase [Metabacillus malikii]|uniref:RNA 2',3'-cyclic phosphodiesterase n=2 Tax=Metabacillus malikii TaxID=1504265 RepID=A0ABT9ZG23_9BACI|nr:2'-5' RNA ligase [Metabacillus malikii]
MNQHAHFFIAVPIKKAQKQQLHNWIIKNKEQLKFQSFVHEEDYHITLAFLGAVPSREQLINLSNRVRDIVSKIPRFELKIDMINVFGKRERPRIFWASVKESSHLQYLQREVFHACLEEGFSLDKKPFNPHITLARKWKADEPFSLTDWQQEFNLDISPFTVEEIHVYQTHLNRIPKYEAIEVLPLEN